MPRVALSPDECQPGGLPMVCMACGRPAEVARRTTFAWRPPETVMLWVAAVFICFPGTCLIGPLALILVPICVLLPFTFTKRRRAWTPLCPDHASYWVVRTWLRVGGTLAVVAALVGAIVFRDNVAARGFPLADRAVFALVIATIAWLIAMAILGQRSIRPSSIADHVELLGVHADFVNALNLRRAAGRAPVGPNRPGGAG